MVSARVFKILKGLCGLEITSTQISRAVAELDTMLEAWRNRPIPPVRHLISCASITSDAHEGLKAALTGVYPGVSWNRCQFHLQQNAQAYVPRQNLKEQAAAGLSAIFNAEDLPHTQAKLAATVEKYAASAPELTAGWRPISPRASPSSPPPKP